MKIKSHLILLFTLLFTLTSYSQYRISGYLNTQEKNKTVYLSLLRYDDENTWIEYSGHFMSGNPLVFEYFEGKYPDHIIQMLERESNNKDDKTNL